MNCKSDYGIRCDLKINKFDHFIKKNQCVWNAVYLIAFSCSLFIEVSWTRTMLRWICKTVPFFSIKIYSGSITFSELIRCSIEIDDIFWTIVILNFLFLTKWTNSTRIDRRNSGWKEPWKNRKIEVELELKRERET